MVTVVVMAGLVDMCLVRSQSGALEGLERGAGTRGGNVRDILASLEGSSGALDCDVEVADLWTLFLAQE